MKHYFFVARDSDLVNGILKWVKKRVNEGETRPSILKKEVYIIFAEDISRRQIRRYVSKAKKESLVNEDEGW